MMQFGRNTEKFLSSYIGRADHIDNKLGWPRKCVWGWDVAAKRTPPRAAKATRTKKKAKAPAKKQAPTRKLAVTGQSLRLAAKQADVRFRRAGQVYVEKAMELEAARIKRADAEQALAAFYAAEAARDKRPFFNFLAKEIPGSITPAGLRSLTDLRR